MHYPGYYESRLRLLALPRETLLDLLDALYGRPTYYEDYSDDELRATALEQHDREWTVPKQHEQHYRNGEE